jgi:hypothetical protein
VAVEQKTVTYEIRVEGELDGHWAEWLDGMHLAHTGDGQTLLRGPLPDQAALYGVLDKLRDLGCALLDVRRVASGPAEDSTGGACQA